MQHSTFIGMAGCGKSTIGKQLADEYKLAFVDVDTLIEEQTGLPLQEVLYMLGDKGFLEYEERTILDFTEVIPAEPCIIAPGGSAIYCEKGMRALRNAGNVLFLDVPFQTIEARVAGGQSRGLVGLKARPLRAIYEERLPLYARYATHTVAVGEHDSVDDTVARVRAALADALPR